MTPKTREKNTEEKIEFILIQKGWLEKYYDYRKTGKFNHLETLDANIDYKVRTYHRQARTEDKIDFIMREMGIFSKYLEVRKEREKSELENRKALALISEDDIGLKKEARVLYANVDRSEKIGEPVFCKGKWVYIDPPEVRK